MTASVDTPSEWYKRQSFVRGMISDLLAGTEAMREAGAKHLPQWPREKPEAYQSRLQGTFLYPAFRDTLDKAVSKPFSKPVTVTDMPKRFGAIEENADKGGTNLTQFARKVFAAALRSGPCHIITDYPALEVSGRDEEIEKDIRPYFAMVTAENLIDVKPMVREDGSIVPRQIRYLASRTEQDGDWGEKTVQQVHVWDAPVAASEGIEPSLGMFRIYEKQEDSAGTENWVLLKGFPKTHSFPGIPISTFLVPGFECGFMDAEPPFKDIAWLNVEHWQSSSDQRALLHFARCILLHITGDPGVDAKGKSKPVVMGPGAVHYSQSADARMEFVEHSGAGLGAGKEDLERIEKRMELLGIQPYAAQRGGQAETASGRVIDEERATTAIQSWVRALENTLLNAFENAATWLGITLSESFEVDVHSDFISAKAALSIDSLLKANIAGKISHKTWHYEMTRIGELNEGLSWEQEVERIEEEGGDLNEPSVIPPEPDPDDRVAAPQGGQLAATS